MSANAKTKTVAGIEFNVPYMLIWAALLALTVIEVFIPEMSMSPTGPKSMFGITLSRTLCIMLLIGLAVIKTGLVAWFYMHLVDERPLIVLVGCTPFLFSVFLTIGLFPW